jgi:hypothetical protein
MGPGAPRPNPLQPDFFIADLMADAMGPARARGPSRLSRASRSLWRGLRQSFRSSRRGAEGNEPGPRG